MIVFYCDFIAFSLSKWWFIFMIRVASNNPFSTNKKKQFHPRKLRLIQNSLVYSKEINFFA